MDITERGTVASPVAVAPAVGAGAALLVVALLLGHAVTDAAMALLNPLLPHVRDTYGVSITQVGLLVTISSITSSVLQPLGGVLGDRLDQRLLAAYGPVAAVAGMSALGFAPGYGVLAVCVGLGGLGSAFFHPGGAALVGRAAGRGRAGLITALFSASGTVGLAVGPILATVLEPRALPWLLVLALPVAVLTLVAVPASRPAAGARPRLAEYGLLFRGQIRDIWLTGVLRSVPVVAFNGLIGFALVARGAGGHIGPTLAVFNAAGALGGIVAGRVSDVVGRASVIRAGLLSTFPLFVLLAFSGPDQWWYYPLVAGVGGMVAAGVPVSIVLAQEHAPRHAATASSMVMGLAWGISGIVFLPIAALADATSPEVGMVASGALLLPAAVVAWRLRDVTG